MAKMGVVGVFEEMVLLSLVRLGEEAYGVPVRREIESRTSSEVAMGAVYATLDRLTEKQLVSSRTGDAHESRGGRPRRYYRIEPAGVEALERSRAIRSSLWDGVTLPGTGGTRP